MPAQSYNFFGLGPGQMAPGQDPVTLAQAMKLEEYNNSTPSSSGQSNPPSINPQALAKMMMKPSGSEQPQFASDGLQVGKLYDGGSFDPVGGGQGGYVGDMPISMPGAPQTPLGNAWAGLKNMFGGGNG